MMKSLLVMSLLVLGAQSRANTVTVNPELQSTIARTLVKAVPMFDGLNFKVGDSCDYNLSGGILSGTMHMFVDSETPQGFWVEQDVNLTIGQQEKIRTLLDKNTGQVLEMDVNGQKQTPPDPHDETVVDSHKDHITVPAGTFDCFYVKIHSKSQNSDSDAWINTTIPVGGLLKTIQPSQIGQITIELTQYHKN